MNRHPFLWPILRMIAPLMVTLTALLPGPWVPVDPAPVQGPAPDLSQPSGAGAISAR